VLRSRSLLAGLLAVAVGIGASFALAGCGSGPGTGPAGRVTDIASPDGHSFGSYAVASSAQGDVALAWRAASSGDIELQELPSSTGTWTKSHSINPLAAKANSAVGGLALAYDGSGRLLVAWTVSFIEPGAGCNGYRWEVEARLREASGKWQSQGLVARVPEGVCSIGSLYGLQLSAERNSFAVGWPSGLRILDGDSWGPPMPVDTPYAPPSIEFFADDGALALWRQPDGTITSAPVTAEGRLGKKEVLADKATNLTVASSPTRAIAAWTRGSRIWARIWSHGKWGETKRLVLNGSDRPYSIAVAITRKKAVVAWAERGGGSIGSTSSGYVLEKQGSWSKPAQLLPHGELADSVRASALRSGEIVVLGPRLDRVYLAQNPVSGTVRRGRFDLPRAMSLGDAFSAGSRAVILARQVNESPSLDGEDPHLLVWVYRP